MNQLNKLECKVDGAPELQSCKVIKGGTNACWVYYVQVRFPIDPHLLTKMGDGYDVTCDG